MTDDFFASMAENLKAQAATFQAMRSELESMTAEIRSPDQAVTVCVSGDGTVRRVTLHPVSRHLEPEALGASIAQTTNRALQQVQEKMHRRLSAAEDARRRLTAGLNHDDVRLGDAVDEFVASSRRPPSESEPTPVARRSDRYAGQPLEERPGGFLSR
ncbi:YbaB/EbfC DNA-binding family protein OS=Tsukamurella paurometabola (strain ATCC 8368 / DSM /CCUG 35730 / CIP 100753 / JCM 10117 / KCTC 9821 / NBRC 16120/ NCIMB 702349 / NCTC 13040) OX=521096 GN=Tpau_3451 PE=4 SV=1 [Tsukamurella paurometabola]|uniref:YbaB/EbfC DNA-binding family protein n=1 Tax=Tsukamurella paurometabola (strain ATCC 8368 / DSM 20162 / CCUG 35730 / CIP 100753 / JCM 10117 / KCTC 9821 / NBRC 16120 / NCIMB 702349 / NCTC 13040) TaxID=521096 RepID=D5UX15_TSUPD|nr:YbaB/EbfC family nucleoid-associated protein [Tsukamurella paurometabola]ADG80034.1 conserved hypothetical protein [Tsukamurella paurometabola DSM 20162]SUP38136.1 DNA-binding protein, YbaB/EbfC family [Tsukamurella paurometabola]